MAKQAKILVVDDDEAIRDLMTKILEDAGYAVDTAADGLQALMYIDRSPPDLLVSDISMPELDGIGLVEGLRFHPDTKSLPIIFLTASEDPRHISKSVTLGVRQVLGKPIRRERLLTKIAEMLAEAQK